MCGIKYYFLSIFSPIRHKYNLISISFLYSQTPYTCTVQCIQTFLSCSLQQTMCCEISELFTRADYVLRDICFDYQQGHLLPEGTVVFLVLPEA
jgi:hypothetical protein